MSDQIPQCSQCRHYFITHEPSAPYGCRAMAFKCRINPARVVYASSGIVCQLYSVKKKERGGSGPISVA